MRNISFMLTTQQIRERTKTVTRRMGWLRLKTGDQLMAVEKGMGLKKGEKIKQLGAIRVISARRERLDAVMNTDFDGTTFIECRLEGFPEMSPPGFIAFFCEANRCKPASMITRIEFEYL